MKTFTCLVSIAALVLAGTSLLAQTDDLRKDNFNVSKNIALDGYDPVSYFDNAPREGEKKFQYTYKGITYFFADAANMNKFRTAPEKYEPAYGGWCAYAMGEKGEKVSVDPETFKLLGGKLYLFYNSWGTNTLTKWNKNESGLKTQADQNWRKFIP
jgi:YHS domain-containing protein